MAENNIHPGESEELAGTTKALEATEPTAAETRNAGKAFGRCGGEHHGMHGNGRCCAGSPGPSNY